MKKRIICLILAQIMLLGLVPTLVTSATEPAWPTNETLASQYISSAKESHPSVLFTEDDIPVLREKIKSGVSSTAYAALKTLANKYLAVPSAPYTFTGGGIGGRVLQLHLTTLAFYGIIEGDTGAIYIDKAREILISAVEQGDLETCYKNNAQLSIGDFATAFAIGYDWLYSYMTDAERNAVRMRMNELGEWIYIASTTGKEPLVGGKTDTAYWAQSSPERSAWNWNTVIHTGLTLISMVTGEHPEWMARGLDRIEAYYKYSKNKDGMPQEGLSYTGYGMRIAVIIDASLVKHANTSLIDRYEELGRFMSYYTWAGLPKTEAGAIDTNQSNSFGNISVAYYLANRYKSEETLWALMAGYKLLDGGVGKLTSSWPGDGFDLPQLIVFEDKALEPKEPTDSGMKNFGDQEVILRSGFSHKNSAAISMASVRVCAELKSIWSHSDVGSVTFHAFDQNFLIDQGAGKRNAADHNGMLFGKEGVTAFSGELISAEEIAAGVYKVVLNTQKAYAATVSAEPITRTVIWSSGANPYLFVFDNATTKEAVTGTINWFTRASNNLTKTDNAIRITGDNASVCDAYLFEESGKGSMTVGQGGAFTANIPKTNSFRVGSLFIASESAEKAPEVSASYSDGGLTLTITYIDQNGEAQTDTITASDDDVIYRSTSQFDPEATAGGDPEVTIDAPEATEAGSDTELPDGDGGCGSVTGVEAAVIASCVSLLLRKRRACLERRTK